MSAALDRLHPVVVHHIVNTLGWPSLRALQEEAAGPVLDGADALLLAPTAGGKTEAAVFPLLTAMDTQRWSGLSVIYVCPLKALLNNLLPRLDELRRLAGPPGRDLARRRGRVGAAAAAARSAGRAADHAGVAGGDADQPQGRARGAVLRGAGGRRGRGARVRRRRPRLAPARGPGTAHPGDRAAHPAGRPVGHGRQPGRAAGLAAGFGARAASRCRGCSWGRLGLRPVRRPGMSSWTTWGR